MKRLVIALFVIALGSPVAHSDSPLEETKGTLRQHVLKLINRDRALYGLGPVELDVEASVAADDYCRRQIVNGTTGHFTTDGLAPYMRYSMSGGNDGVSENAAAWSASYVFNDRALYEMSRRSQDAMMAETPPNDGHKKTILDPHATHVGIGLAWDRGEFRLVHEFIRRYVDWTRPFPRTAALADKIVGSGKAVRGGKVEAITVHHEPLPVGLNAHVANAINSYSLPDKRKDYLPRLTAVTELQGKTVGLVRRVYADGRRGDFYAGDDGTFNFQVPFTEGPGIYTVVVWVQPRGAAAPVAASNVSIRVEGALQPVSRASAAGR